MWQKVAKFKGAEYFRKALYVDVGMLEWLMMTKDLIQLVKCSIIPLLLNLHISSQIVSISLHLLPVTALIYHLY